MNTAEARQKQYELSINFGMNQRYHQFKATHWAKLEKGFRIVVGFLAVASAIATCVTAALPALTWVIVSIVVAVLAALMAVALNVLPFADWERDHRDLFRRWCDMREEIDALLFDIGDETVADDVAEKLRQLECKATRIDALEPAPDEPFLNECYKAEMNSRKEDRSNCEPATV